MKTSTERAPEVPEPGFEAAEVAFEESLGSDFGTASIIGEQRSQPEAPPRAPQHVRSMLTSVRQLSVRDHRTAGMLAVTLGAFGMHKFYLGYHEQGFLLLLATILAGSVSFGLAILAIWMAAFVEGVNYFALSQTEFEKIYVDGTHNWF